MGNRLVFGNDGRIIGIEGGKGLIDFDSGNDEVNTYLKKSSDLDFLKDEIFEAGKSESIFEREFWDLNEDGKKIEPLNFSNGKTQEDVVKEIVGLIKNGNKVIFLKGACGSGKSAIALNVARVLGKASVIVPVKALQKQYEDDYTSKKYLIKNNGKKMKIAVMTGRENHDSIIKPGVSCADPLLPENIKITEKNYRQLVEYYKENPFTSGFDDLPEVKNIRRISIAPSNPYWSPILPSQFPAAQILRDAKKIKYKGVDGREYIFYHRKKGCSYYDQYLAYTDADIIIFNAAKYKAEFAIGRKPETDVEVIDEADEFLDGLFEQDELNLTKLANALSGVTSESISIAEVITKIIKLIGLEEQNKRALGIDEKKVFHISETKVGDILGILALSEGLEAEIVLDEQNYANKALEIARNFFELLENVYATFRKENEELYVKIVSTNLSAKFNELINKNKALIFMSGTLHSENILKNIFGINEYKIVEAEHLNYGCIEIIKTGKEFDCKYENFNSNKHSRGDYLKSLSSCIEKAVSPVLVHVNAFKDLPSTEDKVRYELKNIISSEDLALTQDDDKVGERISLFKMGKINPLFSTKCSRGVDFPGKICNSVIFTKYPNPNVSDTFWTILKKTHADYFWEFYKDKARREFLQRIYRAVRSPEDHVYVLSPDSRVLDAVKEMQRNNNSYH